jgi:hypothetical protein
MLKSDRGLPSIIRMILAKTNAAPKSSLCGTKVDSSSMKPATMIGILKICVKPEMFL